jgi:hypothetical protein
MIGTTGLGSAMLLWSQLSAGAIVAHAKEVDLAIEDLSANVSMTITSENGQEKRRDFRLLMRRGSWWWPHAGNGTSSGLTFPTLISCAR